MVFARSFLETPSARSDFTSRSIETVGSPASIFATRDWLVLIILATSTWLSLLDDRCSRSERLRAIFISIYSISLGVRFKKSSADPRDQPFDLSFFLLSAFTVVLSQELFAFVFYTFWSFTCFLFKHFNNNNCVAIYPVYYSPGPVLIIYS